MSKRPTYNESKVLNTVTPELWRPRFPLLGHPDLRSILCKSKILEPNPLIKKRRRKRKFLY